MKNRIELLNMSFLTSNLLKWNLIFFDQEEEEQVQQKVQTEFTVKLMAFDEKQKVALIKEVKSLLPDTNLVQVLNRNL